VNLLKRIPRFFVLFLFARTLCAQTTRGGPEPSWVSDPYAVYARNRYIAVVGEGPNRAEAEKKAMARLTAFFGQSIQSEFSTITQYYEGVSRGSSAVSNNTVIRDTIVTTPSLDTLVGAEFGIPWESGRGVVYITAYLDRKSAIDTYSEMIRANIRNIKSLTAMSEEEKYTFDGYARYKRAALISGAAAKYAGVVLQAGGPSPSSWNIPGEESLNLEALNIINNITVTIMTEGDRANRIRDAFTGTFSNAGLRTQGNNPAYTLKVTLSLNEDVFPPSPHKFYGFTISAELIKNSSNSTLLPFSYTYRVSRSTYEEAEALAITIMKRRIIERYPGVFREYLAALLPQK